MSDQVSSIRFPAMRQEVLSALESLSDRNHQQNEESETGLEMKGGGR